MVNRDTLAAMTKAELVDLARAANLAGRSKMNKAELVDALATPIPGEAEVPIEDAATLFPIPGVSEEDRAEARVRRAGLYARLAGLVNQDQRCRWRSIEGHGCGLPNVRGTEACALHGGPDRYDIAVPATGRLGFDTWPTLFLSLIHI